jgi:endo-1,4-beta-xylanase
MKNTITCRVASVRIAAGLLLANVLGGVHAEDTVAPAEDKYVKAFFQSEDPFVRDVVLPNIEKNRKGDFTLLLSSGDTPLADAKVSVDLVRHNFHFGTSPPKQLLDDPETREAYFDVWEFGVVENLFKWGNVERIEGQPNYDKTDALVELFKSKGLPIELHFLTGYHPSWLAGKSDDEKAELQKSHARKTLERYHDQADYVQVYNEIWHSPIARASVYFDSQEFFRELANKYPNTRLGVSDCWRFDEPLPDPAEVKRRFPGIDFISIHAHKPRHLWASPQLIYECFDPWIDCGINLHISEFGLRPGEIEGAVRSGTWNDALAAEYFVSMVATVFSHPVARAVNFWSSGPDENLSFSVNRMIRADGSFTPGYYAMKDLIKRKLTTTVQATTSADGTISFRGFYGTYRVTSTRADGTKQTGLVQFSKSQSSASLSLDHQLDDLFSSGTRQEFRPDLKIAARKP